MNNFNVKNRIQKDRSYILVVVIMTAIFSINFFIQTPRVYATTIVQCDPSDGYIRKKGSDVAVAQENLLKVGDGGSDYVHRIFIKFPIQPCGEVVSARLYIYAHSSVQNSFVDVFDPLNNPGLGDLIVYHIGDYGTLDADDFDAASINSDPGVLIPGTDTVNVGYISIDITRALQDDINHYQTFTTFMLRMETDTDYNADDDFWRFQSSRHPDGYGPHIEYTCTVGGTVMASRHTQALTYLLIVIGVVAVGGILKAFTRTYSKPSTRT